MHQFSEPFVLQFETDLSDIETRLAQLRLKVRQIGEEIDAYRNGTAAAMGGGAFLGLLAVGAFYDLATGNASMQVALSVTRVQFYWIAAALATGSITLFALGFFRQKNRDRQREAKLKRLEQELEELIERKHALRED